MRVITIFLLPRSGSETLHSIIPTLFFCSAFMGLTARSKTYNLNPHLICWPWLQSSPSSPRGRARGARCPWAHASSGYRPRASASVERASSPGPRIQYKSYFFSRWRVKNENKGNVNTKRRQWDKPGTPKTRFGIRGNNNLLRSIIQTILRQSVRPSPPHI